MTWKDVPVFVIDGRRIDVAVGLAGGVPEMPKPTDLEVIVARGTEAALIESGPGFGNGFTIKVKTSARLRPGEFTVRCRQKGATGEFGIRATDLDTGAVLVEDTGPAGRWLSVGARLSEEDGGGIRAAIWWCRRCPEGVE